MIKVSHLSKAFNGRSVLDDLSFEIGRGEIVAVMGPSGTGKSVLLLNLIGLLMPDSGTVEIDGVTITDLDEAKLLNVRQQIGYLFQEGALYDFMTVEENLAFPLKEHTRLSRREIEERVNGLLRQVDMEGTNDRYPSQLSGGMKKRAALARALVLGSKVLLCDEPTSGLDPVRSRDISMLICELSRKINCTTIITTHDAQNALRGADRAIILNSGKIAAEGRAEELLSSTSKFVREFLNPTWQKTTH